MGEVKTGAPEGYTNTFLEVMLSCSEAKGLHKDSVSLLTFPVSAAVASIDVREI